MPLTSRHPPIDHSHKPTAATIPSKQNTSSRETTTTYIIVKSTMTITAAVADFFSSLAELLSSVFGTAYWLAHSFVTGFVGLVVGLLSFARNMASGALDLAGNVGRFVTGEFRSEIPPLLYPSAHYIPILQCVQEGGRNRSQGASVGGGLTDDRNRQLCHPVPRCRRGIRLHALHSEAAAAAAAAARAGAAEPQASRRERRGCRRKSGALRLSAYAWMQ